MSTHEDETGARSLNLTDCDETLAFLPGLAFVEDAIDHLESLGGLNKIEDGIAIIAEEHPNVAPYFGLQLLLHQHTALREDEVLLVHEESTTPILRAELERTCCQNVSPSVWGLRPSSSSSSSSSGTDVFLGANDHDCKDGISPDAFVPLEYTFREEHDADAPLDPALAKDVRLLLRQAGLGRILGLARVQRAGHNSRRSRSRRPSIESQRASGVIGLLEPHVPERAQVLWPLLGFVGHARIDDRDDAAFGGSLYVHVGKEAGRGSVGGSRIPAHLEWK